MEKVKPGDRVKCLTNYETPLTSDLIYEVSDVLDMNSSPKISLVGFNMWFYAWRFEKVES